MKKTIFILLCMLSMRIDAQDLQGWHLGVVLQPYNYWLYSKGALRDDDPLNYIFVQPKLGKPNGFAGGAALDYYFSDKFAVGGEFSYSNQTQRYTDEGKKQNEFITLRYLHLPIIAKFRLTPNRVGSIYTNIGIQNSFMTYSYNYQEYKGSNGELEFYNSVKNKIAHNYSDKDYVAELTKPIFKTFQLGVLTEVGYQYSIGERCNIGLGIRSSYDITTIKKLNGVKLKDYDQRYYLWSTPRSPNDRNLRLGLNLCFTYSLQ